jgi:poly(3-hydroxybutyrate) depolymerase
MLVRCFWIAVIAVAAPAAEPGFPAGAGQLTLESVDKAIDVFTYQPAAGGRGDLLLMVFHGLNRDAEVYRDNAAPLADRIGALVAAPCFDAARFPSVDYQRGGVMRNGAAVAEGERTYALLPPLIHQLRQRAQKPDLPCYLIGHSAGGQFLSRLAAFNPTDARRIVVANPSTHLFPTRDMPYPYGFGGLPESLSDTAAIRRYLQAPVTLYLGQADTGSQNLDVSAGAMKQGATRIERGRACFALATRLAAEMGCTLGWRLIEVPGVGHSSKAMFSNPRCEQALFGDEARPQVQRP